LLFSIPVTSNSWMATLPMFFASTIAAWMADT
jgi:hypothetical protein